MKFFTERFIYISKIKNRKKRENWRKTIYRIRRRKRIIYEIFVIETFTYPLIFLQNYFSHPVYAEHKLKKKNPVFFESLS